jgi:hypothetical protein
MRDRTFISTLVMLLWLVGSAQALTDGTPDSTATKPFARLVITADAESTSILLDGHPAGITPLVLDSLEAGPCRIEAYRTGPASWYAKRDSVSLVLSAGDVREIRMSVLYKPRLKPAGLPDVSPILRDPGGFTGRKVGLFASGGVVIIAGIAAAYYKIAADGRNDLYLQTGQASLLDERKRLDKAAGISFVVTEIGFAIFSYLLLTD